METFELIKVSIVLGRLNKRGISMEERILHKSDELYRKFGVRSITMDDIARQLGVSKKTIYQYYPDKDELVMAVTKLNLEVHVCEMEKCCGQYSANAVEEMLNANESLTQIMQIYNPVMIYDLQKYYPNAWNLYRDFRDTNVMNMIKANFERGVKEGLYRKSLDADVLSILRLEQIDLCFNGDVYPPAHFSFTKVMSLLIEHFLYGIVTLKGHKLINTYKNIKEE